GVGPLEEADLAPAVVGLEGLHPAYVAQGHAGIELFLIVGTLSVRERRVVRGFDDQVGHALPPVGRSSDGVSVPASVFDRAAVSPATVDGTVGTGVETPSTLR